MHFKAGTRLEFLDHGTVGCFGPKTDILGVWGRSQKMTFGVPRG